MTFALHDLSRQLDGMVGYLTQTRPDREARAATAMAAFEAVCADWQGIKSAVQNSRLGYLAAYVGQNGLEDVPRISWAKFDVLFLGGDDAWKLGPAAASLVAQAKAHGKWVHMGRVNSFKRLEYANTLGCDSADGTYVCFAPRVNAPKVKAWVRRLREQPTLRFAA
jgi:hypothetical protein